MGRWSTRVAEKVGSRPISKILITSDAGIGVYLEGNMFTRLVGRGRRVLEIGLLGLHDLQVQEFKSILAHEYGHFAHRDTQWSWFVYSMSSSLIGTLRNMPGPKSGGGLVGVVMAMNPAFWALLLFTNLFFRITNGFSRTREVMADLLAMNLYGGETFRNALIKVSIAGNVSSSELPIFALKADREGRSFPGLWQLAEGAFNALSQIELDTTKAKALEDGTSHGDFDSPSCAKGSRRLLVSDGR